METWSATRDTALAAALGTLGFPWQLHRHLIESTGAEQAIWHIGRRSHQQDIEDLRVLRTAHFNGALDPAHPLADITGAAAIRDALLDCANRGTRHHHRRLTSADPAGRWEMVADSTATGLPGVHPTAPHLTTGDLKAAAALVRLGAPLLRIDGTTGPRRFWIGAIRNDQDYATMLRAFRERTLPADHPICWIMQGLANRERLLDLLNQRTRRVMLRPPTGSRFVVVPETANGRQLDEARRFLRL